MSSTRVETCTPMLMRLKLCWRKTPAAARRYARSITVSRRATSILPAPVEQAVQFAVGKVDSA
jgi:hypothetical protein